MRPPQGSPLARATTTPLINGTLGKGELGKNKDFSGLVDIGGGREMYMECHGTGSPTVVLVSGTRGPFDDWTHVIDSGGEPKPSGSAVFPKVGKFTRVCAYDRPGTTRFDGMLSPSTPVRQPTSAQEGAADLHALLRAAKQKGPYLIVAHSWGGLIGRLYASKYPDEVSGLVLLDPGSEFMQDTLRPALWTFFVHESKKLGNPITLEASARSAPPLLCVASRRSCSHQMSAGLCSLASMPRRHARRGMRLRSNSPRIWTPSTSPIPTAATSSRGRILSL